MQSVYVFSGLSKYAFSFTPPPDCFSGASSGTSQNQSGSLPPVLHPPSARCQAYRRERIYISKDQSVPTAIHSNCAPVMTDTDSGNLPSRADRLRYSMQAKPRTFERGLTISRTFPRDPPNGPFGLRVTLSGPSGGNSPAGQGNSAGDHRYPRRFFAGPRPDRPSRILKHALPDCRAGVRLPPP